MNPLDYQYFYRKNLPHFQPPGASLFVTFRLAGSIPVTLLAQWKNEAEHIKSVLAEISDPDEYMRQIESERRRWFGRWDNTLDTTTTGPFWLNEPRIAELIANSLHFLVGLKYELDSFCIMSNHVHTVFTPLQKDHGNYHALPSIMHSLKRYTALEANRLLGRNGDFWQEESFDHVVRNGEELQRIRHYVLNNPVKAGLVQKWQNWPWTYAKNM